ncbi:MAG: LysR family transcriptional regulator [Candidatus Bathyarchaeota archaeon]|nr:LysR family transcriptional regulator [Candidatus Bathyarchaeum tardum]WGM88558.1 MAG: LysR family transcriptional regulator [Candidatus Bathyarchaeum tardum]WNZ29175.1 MAG: LysR family transcriptional regulator [Candidatus Bathyarchaeota archaeon]
MSVNSKHKVSGKVWLEFRGDPLLGKGGAKILEAIQQVESISKAAKNTGMSYRYVWNYLSKLEKRLGEPVVTTFKGGNKGGGGAKLTDLGITLINEYIRAEEQMTKTIGKQAVEDEKTTITTCFLAKIGNLGTKNTGVIEVDLEHPRNLTLVLPKKTVEDLDLQPNDEIDVKIKTRAINITKNR